MDRHGYWQKRLRLIVVLLIVWAIVGFGCSILAVEWMNQFAIGGLPLGFWMAQQGSIYVFIVLVFLYALLTDRADKEAGVYEP